MAAVSQSQYCQVSKYSFGATVGQTFGLYDAPQDNPLAQSLENNHSDLFLQRVLGAKVKTPQ